MHLPEEPEQPLKLDIVPTIDVIFAILAFFIISSLYLTRSEGLPVNLPQAETAEVRTQTRITVTIRADGSIALGDRPLDLSELAAGVQAALEPDTKNVVVLQADEQVTHGRVVEVMDRLRQVEGIALAIATQRK